MAFGVDFARGIFEARILACPQTHAATRRERHSVRAVRTISRADGIEPPSAKARGNTKVFACLRAGCLEFGAWLAAVLLSAHGGLLFFTQSNNRKAQCLKIVFSIPN
jgi:hypothetical protein